MPNDVGNNQMMLDEIQKRNMSKGAIVLGFCSIILLGKSCYLQLKIGTLLRLAAANKFLSSVAIGNPFLIARFKYEAS